MLGRIYKITNLINGKIYIGQTIQSIKDRWYRHVGNSKWLSQSESNMAIKKAIRKYGKDNFSIELVEECDSKLLDEKEIYYIGYYDSYNNGYNSTKGGQRGFRGFKFNTQEDLDTIKELYLLGFSLREIAKEYKVDKNIIKNALINNNVPLRNKRIYKFTIEERQSILNDYNNGITRENILNKYQISKSYLSQLINKHRI